MSLDRRQFLLALGASTAALRSGRAWSADERADVVVIGAGLSGLNAALLLEEVGASVIVLEGRERVGGKMLTFRDVPGLPEAGGASMGAGYGRMLDAARRGGIEIIDVLARPGAQRPATALALDGRVLSLEQWRTSPRNPFPEGQRDTMPWAYVPALMARANPLSSIEDWIAPKNAVLDVSMHEFLKSHGASDAIIELAYDGNPSYGNTAHDVSALMMCFVEGFTKAQIKLKMAMLKAPVGNDRIPVAMAQRLKSPVRLRQVAIAIESGADGTTVHTADGRRYVAGRVICALPFATLRHMRMDPVLPPLQNRAIKTLPHQMIVQCALVAQKPFWEQDGLPASMWTDSPIGRVAAIADDQGRTVSLLVTAYGLKASYLDRLGAEGAQRFIVREVERFRPAAKGQLSIAGYHSWGADPFSAGDWAYFAPGTVTQFMPAMYAPHGRVHFCGEQTAVAARGMEGAMESGERAALEVASAA
jgi:monoamine oxidase